MRAAEIRKVEIEKWDAICFQSGSEVQGVEGIVHPAALFEGKHKMPLSGEKPFWGLENWFCPCYSLITGKEG